MCTRRPGDGKIFADLKRSRCAETGRVPGARQPLIPHAGEREGWRTGRRKTPPPRAAVRAVPGGGLEADGARRGHYDAGL